MTEIREVWFGESISDGSHFLGTVKWPGKLLCWGCTQHQVNQHLWRWDAGRSLLKLPQAILKCTQGGEPGPQRSAFHLIGCVLESPGEVLKKSKYLSPTPEQMSQNMEKESDSCIFFRSSFRWSDIQQVLRSIAISNVVKEKNLDLNLFLALWLCKPCIPVGWWAICRRPSGVRETAMGEKLWRDLKAWF